MRDDIIICITDCNNGTRVRKMIDDEMRREIIIRQRLHWLNMPRKRGEIDIDNLEKVIDHLDNFYNMAPNLLGASDEAYERWFEKLYEIDKRALLFYVMANKAKLSDKQLDFAKDYFDEGNEKINWEAVERIIEVVK